MEMAVWTAAPSRYGAPYHLDESRRSTGRVTLPTSPDDVPFYSASALLDLTGDGSLEAVVAGVGQMSWFRHTEVPWERGGATFAGRRSAHRLRGDSGCQRGRPV